MPASTAVRTPAPYIGGKRNLARKIVALIESTPHTGYYEPFVGMGGIFLRRPTPARYEVINDISGDVVTLFRMLQEHHPYFMDMIRRRLSSRAEFNRLLGTPARYLTDLQRAVRFLYVQRLAFGGKVDGRNFGVSAQSAAAFSVTKLEPILARIHARLADVVIEQLPYADFIRRYDHPDALFYLDPPYFGCETDYGPGVFGADDFAAIAEQLAGIRGRFIMSINDAPQIRAAFSRFSIEEAETTYAIGTASVGAKKVTELIIRN